MAKLLYFGKLTELTGTGEEFIALPRTLDDTGDLRAWLDTEKALGGALLDPSVRIAINDELVSEPALFSETDEIAFLPPVGGG